MIVTLRLNGDVAAEWVQSLETLVAAGGSTTDEDGRGRPLQIEVGRRRATGAQLGPLERDGKSVPFVLSMAGPWATVVRPQSYEHVTVAGATVEAHTPGGEGGDFAVFLCERDAASSVLPHVSSSGGVNCGYIGGGTGSLAADIACARAQVAQSADAPERSLREIEEFLSQPGLDRFTIAL